MQHGDPAYAGQVIITYSDSSSESNLECDVIFDRDLSNDEAEELLDSVSSLLCGKGTVAVFTGQEIICKDFSLYDHDLDEDEDDE
jgi:hypothetical protein